MMKYLFLTLFSLILFILFKGLGEDPKNIPSNLISQKAPSFELKKLGKYPLLKFKDIKINDEPKIINFFASWCPPCKVEHPFLLELSKEFSIFGIAKKDNFIDINKWLEKKGNPFVKIGHDHDGLNSINWGVTGLPETFILDSSGIIKYKHVGPILKDDIEKILKILKKIE